MSGGMKKAEQEYAAEFPKFLDAFPLEDELPKGNANQKGHLARVPELSEKVRDALGDCSVETKFVVLQSLLVEFVLRGMYVNARIGGMPRMPQDLIKEMIKSATDAVGNMTSLVALSMSKLATDKFRERLRRESN